MSSGLTPQVSKINKLAVFYWDLNQDASVPFGHVPQAAPARVVVHVRAAWRCLQGHLLLRMRRRQLHQPRVRCDAAHIITTSKSYWGLYFKPQLSSLRLLTCHHCKEVCWVRWLFSPCEVTICSGVASWHYCCFGTARDQNLVGWRFCDHALLRYSMSYSKRNRRGFIVKWQWFSCFCCHIWQGHMQKLICCCLPSNNKQVETVC